MKQPKKIIINNTLCKYPILPQLAEKSNCLETIVKLTSSGKLDVKPETNPTKNIDKDTKNVDKDVSTLNNLVSKQWDIFWIDTGVSLERVLEL